MSRHVRHRASETVTAGIRRFPITRQHFVSRALLPFCRDDFRRDEKETRRRVKRNGTESSREPALVLSVFGRPSDI